MFVYMSMNVRRAFHKLIIVVKKMYLFNLFWTVFNHFKQLSINDLFPVKLDGIEVAECSPRTPPKTLADSKLAHAKL